MEQAAAGAHAGNGWKTSFVHCLAAASGCALGHSALAQDMAQPLDAAVEARRAEAPLKVEVKASSIPRLETEEMGLQGPRVDLSLLPGGRANRLGILAGFTAESPRHGLQPSPAAGPAFDLGMHWRHTFGSSRQIDITAWRRLNPPDAYTLLQQRQPVYAARVEMTLKPASAKSTLVAATGFVGMQLQSGARISIKRKDGRPMIYYRNTF